MGREGPFGNVEVDGPLTSKEIFVSVGIKSLIRDVEPDDFRKLEEDALIESRINEEVSRMPGRADVSDRVVGGLISIRITGSNNVSLAAMQDMKEIVIEEVDEASNPAVVASSDRTPSGAF